MEKKIMDKLAKLINPLLVLIALALSLMVSNSFLSGNLNIIVNNLIIILGLFVFGMLLSKNRRNNRSWVKKVIISLVMFIIVITQLNIAEFNQYVSFLDIITKNNALLYGVIIYCGWVFFE